jgi:uncharacterized protein
MPNSYSFFLFGARGTGKSQLLGTAFNSDEAIYLDLLDPELTSSLSAHPNRLLSLLESSGQKNSWVVIDEVQKVPALLDIVHSLISQKKFHFALTVSSARKLRRGSANMLAGRAFVLNLFPLTSIEIADDFDLETALAFGTLPGCYTTKDVTQKRRFLKAYAQTYMAEEVIAEQVVRNLPPFRRFLEVAAAHTTEIVSFSNIARDINSDAKTVQRYFDILEDTLLGHYLPAYSRSVRRQQKKAPKFYLFDTGVARTLARRIDQALEPKTFEYGQMFENFIVTEIHRLLSYKEHQFRLSYLRVSYSQEIDLIIELGDSVAFLIEIKSTDTVNERHAANLALFEKDFPNAKFRLISQDKHPKQYGAVLALPWQQAIAEIFSA